jgi:hypothetical protein
MGSARAQTQTTTQQMSTAAPCDALPDYGSNSDTSYLPSANDLETPYLDAASTQSDQSPSDWDLAPDEAECSSSGALPDLQALLDQLAKQSPTLSTAINTARTAGFVFAYGAPGAGTCTKADAKPPTVEIDPDEASSPLLSSTLAHELGHVAHGAPIYAYDPSMDRDRYITENTMIDLEGEAAATVMELEVRDDLLAAGSPDPGITGATAADKIRLWDQFKAGKLTHDALIHELALLFARKEQPSTDSTAKTYWYFYAPNHAAAWDANNPTPTPLPLPSPP